METIQIKIPMWNVEEETGYKPVTTFWQDFCIANKFGINAVKDTFERAFAEWKSDYKFLTELALVLNHQSWMLCESNEPLARLYSDLYYQVDDYANKNLKDEEMNYYFRTLD